MLPENSDHSIDGASMRLRRRGRLAALVAERRDGFYLK
jgi:hypothetical protein